MASPIRTRRAIGSGSARTTGDSGWPRSVPNRHAEIMKRPRPAASARYSGQCSRTAPLMLLPALLDQLRHRPRDLLVRVVDADLQDLHEDPSALWNVVDQQLW